MSRNTPIITKTMLPTTIFVAVLIAVLWTPVKARPPRTIDTQLTLSALESFPNGSYEKLTKLELHNITINELTPNYFTSRGLYNLEQLIISNCNIDSIHENAFKNMTKLKVLQISQSELTALYNYSFVGLISLKRFKLASNQKLASIGKDAFFNLSSLDWLDLSNNAIKELDAELLKGTPTTGLNLENNPLMLNQNGPILKSEVLRSLNLQSCSIHNLSRDAFALLPQLEDLDLSRNPLKLIPTDLRKHNSQLTYLDIDCPIMDNNVEVLCSISTLELPCEDYRLKTQWDCTQFSNNGTWTTNLVFNDTEANDSNNRFKGNENKPTILKKEAHGHTTASTQQFRENDLLFHNSTAGVGDVQSQGSSNIGQNQTKTDVSPSNNNDVPDGTNKGQGQLNRTLVILGITVLVVCIIFVLSLVGIVKLSNSYSYSPVKAGPPRTIDTQLTRFLIIFKNTQAPIGEQV